MRGGSLSKSIIGSSTAKGGFANERIIAEKFNNYKWDTDAQLWLRYMGYDPKFIKELNAEVVPVRISLKDVVKFGLDKNKVLEELKYKKSDVQVRIEMLYKSVYFVENISVKKANSDADYNQVDKRKVEEYRNMWNFDEEITTWLKYFTGELEPPKGLNKRDKRRLFLDEMPEEIRNKIVNFFRENKVLIVCDVIKGRGSLSAGWFMVAKYDKLKNETSFAIANINLAINIFGSGEVSISPKGSLYIGKVVMQRKGGTPDPTKLQFKIKPCEIFRVGGLT